MTKGKLLAYFANEEIGKGGGDIENPSSFSGSLIFQKKKKKLEKGRNNITHFLHFDT